MLISSFLLILGLIAISLAADKFVVGASSLSKIFGLSPLLVGLTVVAIGTSAPEIFVAIASAYKDNVSLAVGNVLGSNIANISLVLGLCATIKPIKVQSNLLKKEYPILFATTLAMWIMLRDNHLGQIDGIVLFAGLFLLLAWFIKIGLQANPLDELKIGPEAHSTKTLSLQKTIIFILIGIIALPISSSIIVENASFIARHLGVSDLMIGLTIVAIGTSLPEIVTAVSATLKNEHDLVIGNIIGSNLFNILAVLPFPALMKPSSFSTTIQQDLLMVCITTVALFILAFRIKGYRTITRLEGSSLLLGYFFYITYLIYRNT